MKKEVLIPYAMVNNKIKSIDDITRLDEAICLECKETLILKNGDVNVKHLAHKPDSSCVYRNEKEYTRAGVKESYEHKYAKYYIKDNLSFFREYGSHIITKDGEFKLGGYSDLKIDTIELEYRGLKNELNLTNDYIPDILIRAEGKLIALEIYKSNKKDPQELRELLKGKGVSVYEVDINHMEKLTIKGIFSHMKLIYSDLKEQFNAAMKPMQDAIAENEKLKKGVLDIYQKLKAKEQEAEELSRKVKSLEDTVERTYSTWYGKFVEAKDEIKELKRKNNESVIDIQKDTIGILKKKMEEKDERITLLETVFNTNAASFKAKNDEIESLNNKVEELQNENKELKAEVDKNKSYGVDHLKWQIDMQKDTIMLLNNQIEELKKAN